nr:SUMF1/EgtB/PvdO family nonheme iron enzyme [Sphingosinicella soli]
MLGACDARSDETACGIPAGALGTFVEVPEGRFIKGAAPRYPEESPELSLHVGAFRIQAHEVTNDQFAAFVKAAGYVTDAERTAGDADGGSAVFTAPEGGESRPWKLVRGATWRAPEGPGSDIAGRGRDPVVHVSPADAAAYAAWAGGRLPTEVEWEYAASLGLPKGGDQEAGAYGPEARPVANTWQGLFPEEQKAADGFAARAPVGCFPPSRIGLYDMIGNVWEITDTPYGEGARTIKGGSYLCSENFCRRYRPAARQPQEDRFSASHVGFRIIKDAPYQLDQ